MSESERPTSATGKRPYDVAWEKFLDDVEPDCDGCGAIKRVACLIYCYEAEVYNGGHHQYFRNYAGRHAAEAIDALRQLGAEKHADVLERAVNRIKDRPELVDRRRSFVETARAKSFDDIDQAYWACDPTLEALLERYIEAHLEIFLGKSDELGS